MDSLRNLALLVILNKTKKQDTLWKIITSELFCELEPHEQIALQVRTLFSRRYFHEFPPGPIGNIIEFREVLQRLRIFVNSILESPEQKQFIELSEKQLFLSKLIVLLILNDHPQRELKMVTLRCKTIWRFRYGEYLKEKNRFDFDHQDSPPGIFCDCQDPGSPPSKKFERSKDDDRVFLFISPEESHMTKLENLVKKGLRDETKTGIYLEDKREIYPLVNPHWTCIDKISKWYFREVVFPLPEIDIKFYPLIEIMATPPRFQASTAKRRLIEGC